jgi:hypothetical protein
MNSLSATIAPVVPVVTVLGAVVLWLAVWGSMVKNARAVMQAQTATATLRAEGLPAQAFPRKPFTDEALVAAVEALVLGGGPG